jgi:hypothetical protein
MLPGDSGEGGHIKDATSAHAADLAAYSKCSCPDSVKVVIWLAAAILVATVTRT